MQPSEKRPLLAHVRLEQTGRRYIAGVALIVLGVLALVATLSTSAVVGETIVFALGITFIAWGVFARSPGLMIPGGILTGIGAGVLLSQSVVKGLSGEAQGGWVTLCMGLGFLAIMPLQAFFTDVARAHWWPAIPGGILSIVGISLLLGEAGQPVLIWLGRLWPVALIVVGLVVIYRVARQPRQPEITSPPLARPPEPAIPPEPATPLTLPRDIAPDALPPTPVAPEPLRVPIAR